MIGWRFPVSDDVGFTGLNDDGVEHFAGNPLKSLAREIDQNSCDAKFGEGPVRVKYELKHLNREAFPGIDQFTNVLRKCRDFWTSKEETKDYFDNAINEMDNNDIPVLKISDFNTTGLRNSKPRNLEEQLTSEWYNLVIGKGNSHKPSGSGGSFGIGKNATFACSSIRTVFYGTRDIDGLVAFQGVAKLVSHIDENGSMTQGKGYFGITSNNSPIEELSTVDPFFKRLEIGTDVFIPGFKYHEDWEVELVKSTIENFFVAIHENLLIVEIGDIVIDSTTLPALINKFMEEDDEFHSYMYYEALSSNESIIFTQENFQDLGRIELYVCLNDHFKKKVAMLRSTGMVITNKAFRAPVSFSGVMIARGEALNEFLRKIEPPSHSDWEEGRHRDKKYAKKILNNMRKWIGDSIRSITRQTETEAVDVEGLSQYLPDNEDLQGDTGLEPGPGRSRPMPVEIRTRPHVRNTLVTNPDDEVAAGVEEGSGESRGRNRRRRSGVESGPQPGPQNRPEESGQSQTRSLKPPKIKRQRYFCLNRELGEYRVSLTPESNGAGIVNLILVGEQFNDFAPVQQVINAKTGEEVPVIGEGKIGPVNFLKEKEMLLNIRMKNSIYCSLEVQVLAN